MISLLSTVIRTKYPLANLIRISAAHLYLTVGRSSPVMTGSVPSYIPQNLWLTKVWLFLAKTNSTLTIADLPAYNPQRVGDCCLMDLLLPTLTASQWCQYNACRIYLRAFTLSDITNVAGVEIMAHCWDGTQNCNSFLQWPFQVYPPQWHGNCGDDAYSMHSP